MGKYKELTVKEVEDIAITSAMNKTVEEKTLNLITSILLETDPKSDKKKLAYTIMKNLQKENLLKGQK